MTAPIRIGARASHLSMTQSARVQARLAALLGGEAAHVAPLTGMTTTGDRIADRRLIEAGGKGLFTKELDEALLEGRIDCAVHSLKDLPTALPDGIVLACIPEREDPRDAFLSPVAARLEELPEGAVLGTASLRRQAQALHARPDLRIETLRGNVETRLAKLEAGIVHATFLALSGLRRLGLDHRAAGLVDAGAFPPAAGQGALAITARADDARVLETLARLNDAAAALETRAERAFLSALDGSCRTPIAAHARLEGETLRFLGECLTPDGAHRWRRALTLDPVTAVEGAYAAGLSIKAEAGGLLVADR